MCIHLQEMNWHWMAVGGLGEGGLCGVLGTLNVEVFPGKVQDPFRGLDWPQKPRSPKMPLRLLPKQVQWAQYFNRFNFTLLYLPELFSWCTIQNAPIQQFQTGNRQVIPSHQLAAPVIIWAQAKEKPQIGEGIEDTLKTALEGDKWFQAHKNECTMQGGLAWMRTKLYVPESQRLQVQEKSLIQTAGHFGFIKPLH